MAVILVLTGAVLVPWSTAPFTLQIISFAWLELIPEVVGLFVLIVFMRRWGNQRWQRWTASREFLRLETVGWVLILFALVGVGEDVMLNVMGQRPLLAISEIADGVIAVVAVGFLTYVIAGPLFEELTFSGLLFSSLRGGWRCPQPSGSARQSLRRPT